MALLLSLHCSLCSEFTPLYRKAVIFHSPGSPGDRGEAVVDGAPWVDDPNQPDTPKALYNGTDVVVPARQCRCTHLQEKPFQGMRKRVVFVTQGALCGFAASRPWAVECNA